MSTSEVSLSNAFANTASYGAAGIDSPDGVLGEFDDAGSSCGFIGSSEAYGMDFCCFQKLLHRHHWPSLRSVAILCPNGRMARPVALISGISAKALLLNTKAP